MNFLRLVVATVGLALAIAPPLVAPEVGAQEEGDPDAAEWCTSHQGTIVDRYPARSASSDEPIAMGPTVSFREFTEGEAPNQPNRESAFG